MRRILLIDGHYFLYRSFYGIRGLANSRGEATNAIYGFIKALFKMVDVVQPTGVAVIWDCGLPEHRTILQPEYKKNRAPMPDDLRPQERWLQAHIELFGPASLRVQNCEADDVIAAYTQAARAAGDEVIIATNDKDIWQLVSEGVSIFSTGKTGEALLLGRREVEAKWGVPPERIGDILSLTGDAADNIPGVEGVGEKTALKLISQFGSLDNLLANIEKIEPLRIREKIATSTDQILSNALMVRLDTSIALPMPLADLPLAPQYEAAREALLEKECHSLLRDLARKQGNGSLAAEQPFLPQEAQDKQHAVPQPEQLTLF